MHNRYKVKGGNNRTRTADREESGIRAGTDRKEQGLGQAFGLEQGREQGQDRTGQDANKDRGMAGN